MMKNAHDCFKAAARLLDPAFNYIPAAETNIALTWMRHGFDPRANRQRRERLKSTLAARVSDMVRASAEAQQVRGRLHFY
jgi:hypothetical protein